MRNAVGRAAGERQRVAVYKTKPYNLDACYHRMALTEIHTPAADPPCGKGRPNLLRPKEKSNERSEAKVAYFFFKAFSAAVGNKSVMFIAR